VDSALSRMTCDRIASGIRLSSEVFSLWNEVNL
jgi:hypothetical protein